MLKKNKHFKLKVREKEQSQRQLKVSHEIQVSLVECFRKGNKLDYNLDGNPLSITKVNISADLRIVNCFFVPFNTRKTANEILEALEQSRFVIRHYVTCAVNLKYSPEIRFYYDSTLENAENIEKLLQKETK